MAQRGFLLYCHLYKYQFFKTENGFAFVLNILDI